MQVSERTYTTIFRQEPLLAVDSTAEYLWQGDIGQLRMGIGSIALHRECSPLPEKRFHNAVLASLGLHTAVMATHLGISRSSVATHLQYAFDDLGIHDRAEIAPAMLACGAYRISQPGPGLGLTESEQHIVSQVIRGRSTPQISAELHLAGSTVSEKLGKIAKRNKVTRREQIGLAALLSGEVSWDTA